MNDNATPLPAHVAMADYLAMQAERDRATAQYDKAVRIIERMKGQIGQAYAALAETEETLNEAQTQLRTIGEALIEANKKLEQQLQLL